MFVFMCLCIHMVAQNLLSWKQRRKSQSKYQHVQDLLEDETDKVQRKPKTFSEMMQTRYVFKGGLLDMLFLVC
jgi:hypothetical protein